MKKNYILSAVAAAFLYLTLGGNASGLAGNYTGSGGSAAGCGGTGCHSSTATAGVAVSVLLDSAGTIVSRYQPGMTYRIRVTGVNATTDTLPKFGYQLSVYSGTAGSGAAQAGSYTDVPASATSTTFSGLAVVSSNASVSSSGSGATGDLDTFSVGWTAPAAGTGTVKMNAVICAVNGDGTQDAGDIWNKVSYSFSELPPSTSINEINKHIVQGVFPNPASSVLSVNLSGSSATCKVSVFDISGREWIQHDVEAGSSPVPLDVRQLHAGVYCLVAESGGIRDAVFFTKQ